MLWAAFVILAFWCADALLFRTGWYRGWLEPHSSAGTLETHVSWLENAAPTPVPEVLVVGDSRIAEGFSPPLAEDAAEGRERFWNFGVPGTSPRVWYYALRDADPSRRRFAAILIPLDEYSDADFSEDPADRVLDEHFLAARLKVGDCPGFVSSFDDHSLRHSLMAACLFRGILLRADVQSFLDNRPWRIRDVEYARRKGSSDARGYLGNPRSLDGLSVDRNKGVIQYPDGLTDTVRQSIEATVLPAPAPQTGTLARYRDRWLRGILDLYRNSPTKIIFFEVPRSPLPPPHPSVPARFLASASNQQNVVVFPQDTFADLEQPRFFADGLHLNQAGRMPFTTRLAEQTQAIVSGKGSR